jgi:NTE family protein
VDSIEAQTPDVLVLGGGGILGEAWICSLLAGLDEAEGFDSRACASYLGTSAGSIVAAMLAAGIDPRSRLGRLPGQPAPADATAAMPAVAARVLRLGGALGGALAGPLAGATLRSTEAGGRLARRALLARVPRGQLSLERLGREVERSGARWDGRLKICAVELESGCRVIFDGTGEPPVSVAEAVKASCAIPGVFRPLTVEGRTYLDGGAWSPTNMDAAEVDRESRVLCLNPTGSLRPTRQAPLGALGFVSQTAAAFEATVLRRRGARVEVVSPDRAASLAIAANLMDPGPRAAVVAAGLAQGRRLAGTGAAAPA